MKNRIFHKMERSKHLKLRRKGYDSEKRISIFSYTKGKTFRLILAYQRSSTTIFIFPIITNYIENSDYEGTRAHATPLESWRSIGLHGGSGSERNRFNIVGIIYQEQYRYYSHHQSRKPIDISLPVRETTGTTILLMLPSYFPRI